MIAVFPDACLLKDDVFGQLPLHIACKFRASGDVLKRVLDSFPEAVRLPDTVKQRLPLHYVCYDGYPNDVSMLVQANRHALRMSDADGKTPVDLCQESKSPYRNAILKRLNVVPNNYDVPIITELKATKHTPLRSDSPISSQSQSTSHGLKRLAKSLKALSVWPKSTDSNSSQAHGSNGDVKKENKTDTKVDSSLIHSGSTAVNSQEEKSCDTLDSALVPWIAAGAELHVPRRGTALEIRRSQTGTGQYSSSNPFQRQQKPGSEHLDAIDTNLVRDGYGENRVTDNSS
jgi:hypothetical protein